MKQIKPMLNTSHLIKKKVTTKTVQLGITKSIFIWIGIRKQYININQVKKKSET